MNYKLLLSYDGSSYCGYQRQINGSTIQGEVERALAKLLGERISVQASGRTDAGVHALGQVINFHSQGKVPIDKLPKLLNRILPGDIRVLRSEYVPEDFHARYSALSKCYSYKIVSGSQCDPFSYRYVWQVQEDLDVTAMQRVTKLIIGEHDFNAFRSAGSVDGSSIRRVYAAGWQKENFLVFNICGNGFLYHMVRNLVGTMVQVGLGKMTEEKFKEFFLAGVRTSTCVIAPAQGLYLTQVNY